MTEIVVPRPAATLIVVRDGASGIEVLLGEKTRKVNFAAGAFVFPGGAVDEGDHLAHTFFGSDRTDSECSKALGVESGGLSYWIAAIRECFEEVGILFASWKQGTCKDAAEFVNLLKKLRADLKTTDCTFSDLIQSAGLTLDAGALHYYSHWVTQAGSPRRYDTRFFIAAAPEGQTASHDGGELVSHRWVRPNDALDLDREGEISLMFPTFKTLEKLSEFSTVGELFADVRSRQIIQPMNPRKTVSAEGSKLVLPGDYVYAEAGKLDPENLGTTSRDIVPGVPVEIDKRVIRLTAPNPSVMTGPGTNTYIVGDTDNGFVVIDPGPNSPTHAHSIREITGGKVKWVLCTHTHVDHSPGALDLANDYDAKVYGRVANYPERQDGSFKPIKELSDGDHLAFGDITLIVVHTPGHASNHLCFLLPEARMLFSGDHIMQGSTVVINPPDGDMSQYMNALEKLKEMDFDWIAPGHGFLIDRPTEAIDRLLVHRQKRERKVIRAFSQIHGSSLNDLVSYAYDDVSSSLHPLAKRSLLAHLIKLEEEGVVESRGDDWFRVD